MIDVTVSVVTYNSAEDLPLLLRCIQQQKGVRWELRIADNASRDGTLEWLRAQGAGRVVCHAENLGFGVAHNRNLADAAGRYLLLLNPDLSFHDGLFRDLVKELEANPRWGIVGPRVLEGSAGREFAPRWFYPGEGMIALEPEWERTAWRWVHGSCMMIRREAFEPVRGFDEDFFLYSEEADLCLRLRKAGWGVGWAGHTAVQHAGYASQAEIGAYERARRQLEGMLTFLGKHYAEDEVCAMLRLQLAVLPVAMAMPGVDRVRLQARRDVARQWVASSAGRGWKTHVPRIVARQCGILWRWLRGGRFPLDDY